MGHGRQRLRRRAAGVRPATICTSFSIRCRSACVKTALPPGATRTLSSERDEKRTVASVVAMPGRKIGAHDACSGFWGWPASSGPGASRLSQRALARLRGEVLLDANWP